MEQSCFIEQQTYHHDLASYIATLAFLWIALLLLLLFFFLLEIVSYHSSSLVFFAVGLLITYVALNLMDGHGQPALLYIVPFTLGTCQEPSLRI